MNQMTVVRAHRLDGMRRTGTPTRVPRPPNLSPRFVRESGWMMSTPVPCVIARPLHAAVAFAHFGVPDGYVAPHDSPAAYARAVEAARGRTAAT
jgi:hypothetical protein